MRVGAAALAHGSDSALIVQVNDHSGISDASGFKDVGNKFCRNGFEPANIMAEYFP